MRFDSDDILRTFRLIAGDVTEIRVKAATRHRGQKFYKPVTLHGFFDDPNAVLQSLAHVEHAEAVWFCPNRVNSDVIYRRHNKLDVSQDGLTSDKDIARRTWLIVDLDDNDRLKGISASHSELQTLRAAADELIQFTRELGWSEPFQALSGNGFHLLYPVDLPVDDGGLVECTLKKLKSHFPYVDETCHNPSRMLKLYGTLAAKGEDHQERPWRLSKVIYFPESRQPIPAEVLEALPLKPGCEPEQNTTSNQRSTFRTDTNPFDIDRFMDRFSVIGPTDYHTFGKGARRWIFNESPMCEHNDRAAFVIQFGNGAVSASCHHQSCNWSWQDLRSRYDDSYRARRESSHTGHDERSQSAASVTTLEQLTVRYLDEMRGKPKEYTKLNISKLDNVLRGGVLPGEVIWLAAKTSQGKSLVGLQVCHSLVTQNLPGLFISVEMSDADLANRTLRYISQVDESEWHEETDKLKQEVQSHFNGTSPLQVSFDRQLDQILARIRHQATHRDLKFVVLDYLQKVEVAGSDNQRMSVLKAATELQNLAKEFGLIMVGCVQMRRDSDALYPKLSDLEESGRIEQSADIVVACCWKWKEAGEDPSIDRKEFRLQVLKNRARGFAETTVVNGTFNGDRQMILFAEDDVYSVIINSRIASHQRFTEFDQRNN